MSTLNARGLLPCFAALCISPAVLAQTEVQGHVFGAVSLQNVQFTLTDLNPDDGVAPGLVWNDGVNISFLGVWQNGRENDSPTYTSLFYDRRNEAGTRGDEKHVAFESYALSMKDGKLSAVLDAPLSMDVSGWIYNKTSFTLTPFTAVTFSAKVEAEAGAQVSPEVPEPPSYTYDKYIESGYSGELGVSLKDKPFSMVYPMDAFGIPLTVAHAGPVSLSKSGSELISVTAQNTGSTETTWILSANVSMWARSPALAVPELATWAQMLCGLTLLGGLGASRRHRK